MLESDTQNWFSSSSSETTEGRVLPGESAYALMGVRLGTVVASRSGQWKGEHHIVSDLFHLPLPSLPQRCPSLTPTPSCFLPPFDASFWSWSLICPFTLSSLSRFLHIPLSPFPSPFPPHAPRPVTESSSQPSLLPLVQIRAFLPPLPVLINLVSCPALLYWKKGL